MLRRNGKMTLLFTRDLTAVPVQIWCCPAIRSADGGIGECETILRMTEHAPAARPRPPTTTFSFTPKASRIRRPSSASILHTLSAEVSIPLNSNERANAFVLKDMNTVISNWRGYLDALETNSFRYYVYNFFWISGRLLHQFDFGEYVSLHRELAPPQQRLHRLGIDGNTTRHIFSLFPIKLYAFKNGIEMDKPAARLYRHQNDD